MCDGYIVLIDDKGVWIVVDNLCGMNEFWFDVNEEWFYVVEIIVCCVMWFCVIGDILIDCEIYGLFVLSGFNDGIVFDVYGNLWIILIMVD